jgi:nucleotide-binding universal stress UspA family protein
MYSTMLVAVDHSDISERVLAAARELASLSDGEIWVLHVREREITRMGLVPTESEAEAEAAVTTAASELAKAGVRAHGMVRDTTFGHAAREIIEGAQEHGADVIIMGSRGRSDLAGLVLGSTAHKVIHLADRPVLVVR